MEHTKPEPLAPNPSPLSTGERGEKPRRRDRIIEGVVVIAAVLVALVSVRPYAYGANDKSRFATVECLVDYHTLAIDRSVWFDQTCDKIRPRADGPFYSDKPPVLALMLAVLYQALHSAFGLSTAADNEGFCYLLTLASCGVAYVAAVWCVYRLGRAAGLSPDWAAALAASFGLATLAPVYACHLNSNLPTLAAAAAILLNLTALKVRTDSLGSGSLPPCGGGWGVESPKALPPTPTIPHKGGGGKRLLLIGLLAGFAYALEQPTGGLLLAAAAVAAAVRLRRPSAVVWIGLAALPWVILHHAVVYAYAGTLGPPNANPAYFDYPGSLFDAGNLTGRWNHAGPGDFAAYAFLMLFGDHGFILSNPTLLLALPAAAWALRRPNDGPVETVCFGLWGLGVWLVYAALSTNYGGQCCSIRWFVPLLAPAYLWLALLLRDSSAISRRFYRIERLGGGADGVLLVRGAVRALWPSAVLSILLLGGGGGRPAHVGRLPRASRHRCGATPMTMPTARPATWAVLATLPTRPLMHRNSQPIIQKTVRGSSPRPRSGS